MRLKPAIFRLQIEAFTNRAIQYGVCCTSLVRMGLQVWIGGSRQKTIKTGSVTESMIMRMHLLSVACVAIAILGILTQATTAITAY